MKFSLIFFMLSALAVAVATPYLMRTYSGGSVPGVYSAPADVVSDNSSRQTFYKWQDASGQWHFGDDVPDGVNAVPVNVDTAANILAPVGQPKTENTDAGMTTISPQTELTSPTLPVITPERASEALKQAEQIKALMEQRTQYLDSKL